MLIVGWYKKRLVLVGFFLFVVGVYVVGILGS